MSSDEQASSKGSGEIRKLSDYFICLGFGRLSRRSVAITTGSIYIHTYIQHGQGLSVCLPAYYMACVYSSKGGERAGVGGWERASRCYNKSACFYTTHFAFLTGRRFYLGTPIRSEGIAEREQYWTGKGCTKMQDSRPQHHIKLRMPTFENGHS